MIYSELRETSGEVMVVTASVYVNCDKNCSQVTPNHGLRG